MCLTQAGHLGYLRHLVAFFAVFGVVSLYSTGLSLADTLAQSQVIDMETIRTTFIRERDRAREISQATSTKADASHRVEIIPTSLHESLTGAAISSDNRFIITSGHEGTVRLWDVKSGRLIRVFMGHTGGVGTATFSSDGRHLLFASGDSTVKLWDIMTGDVVRTYKVPSQLGVTAARLSPDGKRIYTAQRSIRDEDPSIKEWDRNTGRGLRSFSKAWTNIGPLVLSSDGARLIAGGDHLVAQVDVKTGKMFRILKYPGRVAAVALSSDGARIAAGNDDGSFKIWDWATGRELKTVKAHESQVWALAFSPDGRRIVTGSTDDSVRVWDASSGVLLRTVRGHQHHISSVSFSQDGLMIISASLDGTARLWDATSGNLIQTFGADKRTIQPVSTVAFSPNGDNFIAGRGALELWDARNGALLRSMVGENTAAAAFSSDGRTIFCGCGGVGVTYFETETGRVVSSYLSMKGPPGAYALDGRLALVGSDRVYLADILAGQVVRGFSEILRSGAETGLAPRAVAISPDANLVASGGEDKVVRVWDTKTGALLHKLKVEWGSVDSIVFSPDGTKVLSGHLDNSLRLWNLKTGSMIRSFEGHKGPIKAGIFSFDGKVGVSGSDDGTVKLWDVATGQMLRSFEGHTASVNTVAFSPDATRILSGSADGAVKLWNTGSGELLVTLIGTPDGGWLAITPEGFFALSGNAKELINVVHGLDVYSVDQLFQSLYRPDLVREKLSGDPHGLVRDAAARLDLTKALASGNAPEVRAAAPRDGAEVNGEAIRAEVDVTDRGGGIGRIEWRVNGVVVGVEDRSVPPVPNAAPIHIARDIAVQEGQNQIDIIAYNQSNLIASLPARATVVARTTVAVAPPRVHVLAVGLNDYAEKDLRLANAVADAQSLAVAFTKSGRALYDKAEAIILRDADVTRQRLEAAFNEIATKIKPQDIFVFFIAGHGKTLDGRYYFIPQDFRFEDVQSVIQQGITQEEWQRWFAKIPARKSLLLFDTCESGSLTGDALETRALERTAAHGRLAESTGRTIITASTDTGQAYEGFRGHGLFAYNLLEALQSSDADSNGAIEVSELAAFTYAQVVELSERVFEVKQVPQVQITGVNYAVGRPTPVFKATEAAFKISSAPTHVVTREIESQVRPFARGISVRRLDPSTRVTVVKSEQGWALVAQNGKPIGYVPLASITPIENGEKQPNGGAQN